MILDRSRWPIFLTVFLGAFGFCIAVNHLNKANLPATISPVNSKSLVLGGTIYSIDNEWYLDPAKNFLNYSVYAVDKDNPYSKVRRTPGYSTFYGIHYYLFGEKLAHQIIGYTQSILFAFSVVILGLSVFNFTNNWNLSLLISILYGICPFTIGFAFYTITEAIHPAFVIFSFYFLSLAFKEEMIGVDFFLGGLLLGLAAMIRPSNILFGMILLWLVYRKYPFANLKLRFRNAMKVFVVFGLGFAIPFVPWVIRNYQLTKEFIPFEKFYNESPMGMGRSQLYLSKWWMCFDNPRQESMVFSMLQSNELTDSVKYDYVNQFVDHLPDEAFYGSTRDEVLQTLIKFQDCYNIKKNLFGTSIKALKPNEAEPECEKELKEKFKELINRYKQAAPIRYYLITPFIKRGKEYIAHSFSSMYGSLNPDDKKISVTQTVIKSMMYFLNVALWLSVIGCMFIKDYQVLKIACLIFILVSFLFLINAIHVEARYMLSAYPFLYVLMGITLNALCVKILQSVRSRSNRTING